MKATGIIRNVDDLGRVVIPKEMRRTLGIEADQPLEIFTDDDAVILKKYQKENTCMVTGEISDENMTLAGGNIVLSPEGAQMLLTELQRYTQGDEV